MTVSPMCLTTEWSRKYQFPWLVFFLNLKFVNKLFPGCTKPIIKLTRSMGLPIIPWGCRRLRRLFVCRDQRDPSPLWSATWVCDRLQSCCCTGRSTAYDGMNLRQYLVNTRLYSYSRKDGKISYVCNFKLFILYHIHQLDSPYKYKH